MQEARFSLNISSERYMEYYRGVVKDVIVTSHNGRRIQFPAKELRPFVQSNGIYGNFRILFSDENKFIRLERI